MMETRRGMETRADDGGRRAAREKERNGGREEGSPGRRETCRGRNEFEKGLSALFRSYL